ncbi:MAG: SO_0444 family Cu/Zn efflux transporter [Victivallales bacterium]|nr:SO_0444 family Cu/Zn efflux transporter [Victivallales bacterium]
MDQQHLITFAENIWHVTTSVSFWLLAGLSLAGIIHLLVPDDFVERHLGSKNSFLSVLKAVSLGVPMPLCSCGVIPAALGIKKQGASDAAAIGFLISTPQTGVDSIMLSASMLGLPFAIFKVFSAFFIGLAGGCIASIFRLPEPPGKNNQEKEECCSSCCQIQATQRRPALKDFLSFTLDDLMRPIWKWLVLGIIVSAAISTWLPENFFTQHMPENIFLNMLATLAVSLPMYVCATSSVPVAAALVATGMPAGSALVFLMAGPATNVATIGAVYKAFGARNLAIYLLSIITGSMLGGFIFDQVLASRTATPLLCHSEAGFLSSVAAVIFIILILRSTWLDIRKFFNQSQFQNSA